MVGFGSGDFLLQPSDFCVNLYKSKTNLAPFYLVIFIVRDNSLVPSFKAGMTRDDSGLIRECKAVQVELDLQVWDVVAVISSTSGETGQG